MKKCRRLLLVITILLMGTSLIAGCNTVLVAADEEIEPGEIETRQFDHNEFTEVDISSAFSYEIQKADGWSVKITAGTNLFEYIILTKSAQELDIDMNFPGGTIWTSGSYSRPKVTITMPELAALDSSGATDGTVTGFSSEGDLVISLDGASEIELNEIDAARIIMDLSGASRVTGFIQADSLELEVGSASRIRLEGSANYLAVDASGASKVEFPEFIVNNADITLRDASRGVFNLVETLNAKVNGVSMLEYTGEPVIGTLEVAGASTFRKK